MSSKSAVQGFLCIGKGLKYRLEPKEDGAKGLLAIRPCVPQSVDVDLSSVPCCR